MMGESIRLMAIMRLCIAWALVGLSSVVYGETRVEIERVAEGDLLPGDLLEVKITAYASEYNRYALVEPNHSALRFVATQGFPVRLNEDSEYESKWMLVYQTLQSGSLSLEGGFLELANADEPVRMALAPLALEVLGFGPEADHDEVERFELDSLLGKVASRSWVLALLIGLIALFYLGMRLRLRREAPQSAVDEDSFRVEVSALRSALDSGDAPHRQLVRFLEEFRSRCSPSLAKEIELFVYSKNGNSRALLDLIGKEFPK